MKSILELSATTTSNAHLSTMLDGLKENPTPTGPQHGPMRTDKEARRVGETVEFRNRRVKTRAKAKAARIARKRGGK